MPNYTRRDRTLRERKHDPYRAERKLPTPSACRDCGIVYRSGRWERPTPGIEVAGTELCPSCQRVRDRDPAGILTVAGEFLHDHRDEILGLIKNLEARRIADHPLQRIMNASDDSEGMRVETTDIHLCRALGDALHAAYGGELSYHYEKEGSQLRVHWQR